MSKKMNLKVKFIAYFLLIGLLPVIIVSFISFFNFREVVKDEVLKSLDMLALSKSSAVADFFTERERQLQSFAAANYVFEPLNVLKNANWNGADQAWLEQRGKLAVYSQTFKERNGIAVIFLTDLAGKVIYSSGKNLEGSDFSQQEYIQGALTGEFNWSDLFTSELLGLNMLVLSGPVKSNGQTGEILGTVNLAGSGQELSSIIQAGVKDFAGSTDAYLVSQEGILLTERLSKENAEQSALQTTLNAAIVQMLAAPISQGDLDFSGQENYVDALGEERIAIGRVVRFADGHAGVVVEKSEAEAFAALKSKQNKLLMILLLTSGFVIAAGYFFATSITKPISQITGAAKKVAAGDLTISADIKREDELGELANAFNRMNESLRNLMRNAAQTAAGVNEGSDALSQAVESASVSLEEVAASANQFANNAQDMAGISNEVAASAVVGSTAIDNAARQMQEINTMVEDLRNVIHGLDKRSQEIGSIVDLITDVAEQTNLLALNAAIEAARVGEQGRGFAVVAEEVRKLAEQSRNAADEIAKLVKETQAESGNAVSSMQEGVKKVRAGTEAVLSSGETFQEIVQNVQRIVLKIERVSSGAQEISAGSEEIAASTEEQASVMEEINASAEELKANVEVLTNGLQQFKF